MTDMSNVTGVTLLDRFLGGGGGGGGSALLGAALGAGAALGTAAALGVLDQTISNSSQIQGVGGSSSSNAISDEEVCLNAAAQAALAGEDNNYNWDTKSLKEALGLALNVVVNGELTKVKEIKKEKFTVYLGKYIYESNESYENVAKTDEGSVVFNMSQTDWEKLMRDHGGKEEVMWILNKFFLAYCISKNCDFVLTTAPDPYCLYGVPKTDSSYSKELSYIYSKGYVWNPGAPAYTRVSRA
jgi:hypothetical protein